MLIVRHAFKDNMILIDGHIKLKRNKTRKCQRPIF